VKERRKIKSKGEPQMENWRVRNRERRQKKKSRARTPAAAGKIQTRNGMRKERDGDRQRDAERQTEAGVSMLERK